MSEAMAAVEKAVRFGIKINKNEEDSNKRVTYLYDAVGMIPAVMDFVEGAFNYGSWGGVEFVKNNYPCMVKFDGTEDYRLSPDNYELKEDGAKSDITDIYYAGNAMSAFKGGWLCQYETATDEYIIWSNVKYDAEYNAYHRTGKDGTLNAGFYRHIYTPSLVENVARSLSGCQTIGDMTAEQENEACKANGDKWGIKERYESLEIGAARTNLTKTITAAQKEAQELIVKNQTRAEQIKKQIENTIKNVTAAITGNSGGYVVLHPEKNPQEIFILDTPDTSKAKNVWRWNLAGLGHSSTGVNGEFTTAITADGQIVADFITAGELTGAILKAGTVYAEALDVEYRNKVTKHATDAAEAALNSAKQYANGLQESTNKEIQDVNNAIDDINNELETTVADGIITESEKAAIQKMLQIIVKEKEEADAKHEELFDNDYVPSAELNAMHKAWLTVFGTANTAKYNVLVTAINNVINSETKEEIEKNMETYRTAYSEYGSAVTEYQTAVSIAIEAAANAYAAEKANSVGETVTKEMTAKIESTASEITLLCKTIEEHNMHNYVAGGDFKDGFTDEWYTSSENNEVITDSTLGVCAKISKTSSTPSYIRCKIGVLPAGTYRVRYKAAAASGSESNARVQCTFYSTQTTAYGLLKSTEWTTVEREVTLPESTSTRYLYLYAYTQGAAVYVKDVEVLGQMSVYTEAQLKINSDSITQEVKRAKGIEDELRASIKVNAENITSCVTKGNVGSYITQYYNNVIVAFNNSSKYVQINAGEIAIYDYGVSASKKRAVFDEQGNHFYRDNYYVGKIGTNQWVDNNAHKGLVFDLETQGKYMAWAQKPTEGASSYTTILCYSRANSIFTQVGLHLGCNMYGHGWILDNVDLRNCSANGYTTFTGTLPVVLEIHKTDNNGGIGWTYGNVYIKNGLITSIPQ